jgi:hypothetical protein
MVEGEIDLLREDCIEDKYRIRIVWSRLKSRKDLISNQTTKRRS